MHCVENKFGPILFHGISGFKDFSLHKMTIIMLTLGTILRMEFVLEMILSWFCFKLHHSKDQVLHIRYLDAPVFCQFGLVLPQVAD